MTLLTEAHFVCLDCEFTGLDFERDQIIEVAAIRFTLSGHLEEFSQLIKPDCPISKESFAVHHISEEMVANQPSMKAVLPHFLAFLKEDLIVGHAVGSDLEMLMRAAERAVLPCTLKTRPFIDTLRLARFYGDSPNNSLEKLTHHFNIPANPAHRAMNDVEMNIEVFKHLVKRFKRVEQVMEVLSKPINMKYMPLGKHKGRLFSEIPLQYLQWATHMDFDQDLLYSIRLELKKRRKGSGFKQLTNPFSDL